MAVISSVQYDRAQLFDKRCPGAGLLQKKSQEGTQTTMEATLMAQQTPSQREQVLAPVLASCTCPSVHQQEHVRLPAWCLVARCAHAQCSASSTRREPPARPAYHLPPFISNCASERQSSVARLTVHAQEL